MELESSFSLFTLEYHDFFRKVTPAGPLPMKIVHRILWKFLPDDQATVTACALVCRRWNDQIGNVHQWMLDRRRTFPDVFPFELEELILSFVDDRPTLVACSLVCRAWVRCARASLFRAIRIDTSNDAKVAVMEALYPEQVVEHSKQFLAYDAFMAMIDTNMKKGRDDIRSFVRELHLDGWSTRIFDPRSISRRNPDGVLRRKVPELTAGTICKILALLPRLNTLTLQDVSFHSPPHQLHDHLPLEVNIHSTKNGAASRYLGENWAFPRMIAAGTLKGSRLRSLQTTWGMGAFSMLELGATLDAVGAQLTHLGLCVPADRWFTSHITPADLVHLKLSSCTGLHSFAITTTVMGPCHIFTAPLLQYLPSNLREYSLEIRSYTGTRKDNKRLRVLDGALMDTFRNLERAIFEVNAPQLKGTWQKKLEDALPRLRAARKLVLNVKPT